MVGGFFSVTTNASKITGTSVDPAAAASAAGGDGGGDDLNAGSRARMASEIWAGRALPPRFSLAVLFFVDGAGFAAA